ncbi:hypothetical protein [Mesoaciditoga lauensis]|uniref:hypothetical protein n=1 Tax=Mesoaciditoga lauensis TaxID=1495039 RepID=UPI0012E05329|nr:hypothetical protein [Mesoaciditoga lauensis]
MKNEKWTQHILVFEKAFSNECGRIFPRNEVLSKREARGNDRPIDGIYEVNEIFKWRRISQVIIVDEI